MVTEKDFVTVPITKEMREQAKGLLVRRSLIAKPLYEGKTNEELEEIIRLQIWMHYYGSVSSSDDVEWYVCEGILVEDRGYTWVAVELLWYGVMMESRRNGMEFQVSYRGEAGGGSETVDYTKPYVGIRTSYSYIELSGNELAECYL
jgi:hypothetical protein